MTGSDAVRALLGRVRDWCGARKRNSASLTREISRVAEDLGLSSHALKDLIARGPDAADLLYERMKALDISKADVDHAAHGMLRDLQSTCACCSEKGICEMDLAKHPDDPVWKSYCPNAVTLESLTKLKG